jgi:hypothetical protein
MSHDVFISYSSQDRSIADAACAAMEARRIRCWIAPRDILPGTEYGGSIVRAIRECRAMVLIFSGHANESPHIRREVELALSKGKFLVIVNIENVHPSPALAFYIGHIQGIDAVTEPFDKVLPQIVQAVSELLPFEERAPQVIRTVTPEAKAKGYVFISYSKSDVDFVEQLKGILKRRGYAYWDYSESERDYHNALYRELEEKIEHAAAFMCVVTDSWRETEWPAAEYLYAREAKVPVFVIQAKRLSRPVPIIINQQTRIDMATDFEKGSAVLEHELDKKGL